MDFDAIAVFVKVVEAGSFSGAARRLDMPKATVSAKVARLEQRLGLRLLHRTTRALRLTEGGEQYFHHCAAALREVALAEAALQSVAGRPSGVLKVTAPVDVGHALLPRIVHAYAAKYPQVSVELLVTNRIVDLVAEGIDLAIRPAQALKDSSLMSQRFLDMGSSLWASPAYLQRIGTLRHPRDLRKAQILRFSARRSLLLTDGRADFEIAADARLCADDFETLRALLLLGAGIAWLPDFLATEAAQAGTLAPVLPRWRPKERGALYFVYAGGRYGLPKVKAFIATALELAHPGDAAAGRQVAVPARG